MSKNTLPPIPEYPQESKAPRVVEAVTTAVEIAGDGWPGIGFIKERLLDRYVRDPLDKKLTEFHTRIAVGLARLENTLGDFDPSRLENNDEFVAAVYAATQAAMCTSSEMKREALCNGVLNIAAGFQLDEVLQGSFIRYVEAFSSLHIEVLKMFHEPGKLIWLAHNHEAPIAPTKRLIGRKLVPAVATSDALERVLDDLDKAGMTAITYGVVIADGLDQKSALKPAGEAFLKYISAPTP